MALYVEPDYWIVGYAEGDVEDEPRIIQLHASRTPSPVCSASTTDTPGYESSLTTHSTYGAGAGAG